MRDYFVHFSFYSEKWGNFDDIKYTVSAETPFEAREKAWPICDADEETKYRSNIRQYGVTWEPNILGAGDYFNSRAAGIKQYLGYLKNVAIPNDRIANKQEPWNESQQGFYRGALNEVDDIAKDLYSDKGMTPPSLFEELHYTDKICGELGFGDKADALLDKLDRAKKWDRIAMMDMRDLFNDGYITLCGETALFKEHFSRNGVYPVYNNPDERDYRYISRWQNKTKIAKLSRLPLFKETDVVPNSAGHIYYEGQILLINSELLADKHRTPQNMLWTLAASSETGEDIKDGVILVENAVSGNRISCKSSAFLGTLRPDIVERLDFDALKNEYASVNRNAKNASTGLGDEEFEL